MSLCHCGQFIVFPGFRVIRHKRAFPADAAALGILSEHAACCASDAPRKADPRRRQFVSTCTADEL